MATDAPPQPAAPPSPPPDLKILWTRAALFVAVLGVLGSLHLSLTMELRACPLCFYQRAFVMSAAAVLAFGMFMPGVPTAAVTVLALAPAAAGLGVAAHHTYLVATGFLLCPEGVSKYFSAPAESLIMFVLLVSFLLGDLFHRKAYVMQGLGAVLLGYVFYTTCFKATPEMTYNPNAPTDGCRVAQESGSKK